MIRAFAVSTLLLAISACTTTPPAAPAHPTHLVTPATPSTATPTVEPTPVTSTLSMTAGHACFVHAGKVLCWGRSIGVFGRSYDDEINTPTEVPGLPSMTAVATGSLRSCAVDQDRHLWCWGRLDDGSLPHRIESFDDVMEVVMARHHTCARDGRGDVWCWGDGPLGAKAPKKLESEGSARQIAVAENRTCGLDDDGTVWCIGVDRCTHQNSSREDRNAAPKREELAHLAGATAIALNEWGLCGILPDGTAHCTDCKLGVPPHPIAANVREPHSQSLRDVLKIVMDGDRWCALLRDGSVKCWRASGSPSDKAIEVPPVTGISDAVDVAVVGPSRGAYDYRTCVLRATGALSCWGSNKQGELGLGGPPRRDTPPASPIAQLDQVEQLATGVNFTCLRRRDGEVVCTRYSTAPEQPPWSWVTVANDATDVTARGDVACVLHRGGTVSCDPHASALDPLGPNDPTGMQEVAVLAGATRVFVTRDDVCGAMAGGKLLCLGLDMLGEPDAMPSEIKGLSDVVQIVTGEFHTCARSSRGVVRCWGENATGALGIGSRRALEKPGPQVAGVAGTKALAAAGAESCAVSAASRLLCWGRTRISPDEDPRDDPLRPKLRASGIRDVAVAWGRGCVAHTSGAVSCWGESESGDDDGNPPTYAMMTRLHPIAGVEHAKHVAMGESHTCVLRDDARVACWGSNEYGQLGDNTVIGYYASPVKVWPLDGKGQD